MIVFVVMCSDENAGEEISGMFSTELKAIEFAEKCNENNDGSCHYYIDDWIVL